VKRILLGLIFLAVSGLYAQNLVDENGLKQGKWEKKYKWGTVRYTGQFEDDKEIGLFKFYDGNGNLVSTREYITPGGKSKCIMFNYDQEIHAKGLLNGKNKTGDWYYFANDGRDTIGKETYIDGALDGIQYTYFEEGGITEVVNYVKGVKHGEWIEYYPNGQVNTKAKYVDGKLQGEIIYYHSNGKIRKKGQYTKGIRRGVWTTFDASGKPIRETDYDKPRKKVKR
jgi:antitoxin component YwqK of YwqJK toxin-antitoxin module